MATETRASSIGRELMRGKPSEDCLPGYLDADNLWFEGKDGQRESVADFLLRAGRKLPESVRAEWSLLCFPSLLDKSALGERIEPLDEASPGHTGWDLPASTRIVLEAWLLIQATGTLAPAAYRRAREALRVVQDSIERPPDEGVDADEELLRLVDSIAGVYLSVVADLGEREALALDLQRLIEEAGYIWDWDRRRVLTPNGSNPRLLLRDLVRAVVLESRIDRNTVGERETIADRLAFILPDDLLGTGKRDPIGTTLDNVLANP